MTRLRRLVRLSTSPQPVRVDRADFCTGAQKKKPVEVQACRPDTEEATAAGLDDEAAAHSCRETSLEHSVKFTEQVLRHLSRIYRNSDKNL